MSTPRRKPTGGIRRPQVAGRPRTGRADDETAETTASEQGGVAVDERSGSEHEATGSDRSYGAVAAAPVRSGSTGDDEPAAADAASESASGSADAADGTDGEAGEHDADGTRSRRGLGGLTGPTSRTGVAALAVVTVLLAAAAVFFAVSWYRAEFSGAAANTALTDVGTTSEVNQQIGDAVTKVYSFDYARLDQAEGDARAVITPAFAPEFERIFGSVRKLAPQQKAVVTATIPKSAVADVDGDHATVYVFVNQVIRRQADGGAPQQGSAAARLRVEADHVDGAWKIASMTPA
ncbi:hypothetical protein [Pseudonocardia phyllosphaerae]|uniref:hypothetical protein n=1 Tax=Pseudonocardia phyllosphaerae TaxID=3390502 RepID=UPI00397E0909